MLPGTQAVLLHILSESSTFRKWLYLLLTHTHTHAHTRFYTHSLTTSFLDNACNFYSSPEAWKYVGIENAEAPFKGNEQGKTQIPWNIRQLRQGLGKDLIPSSPFLLPLSCFMKTLHFRAGTMQEYPVNPGMGILYFCLMVKWPQTPPLLTFCTQRTVKDNQQSNAFSAISEDTRTRQSV